jgi:hypothetical protein
VAASPGENVTDWFAVPLCRQGGRESLATTLAERAAVDQIRITALINRSALSSPAQGGSAADRPQNSMFY